VKYSDRRPSDLDKDNLGKTAAKMAVLAKTPGRIRRVCGDIVQHFQSKVEPNGFTGQIVTFDRESCLLYKTELDKLLPPEASESVMTVNANEPQYKAFGRSKDEEEWLLDRFRNPNDPLKLLIITSKLLTGFDAPILQAMYLDKALRKSLFKYKLHADNELFEKAYSYIRQYYRFIVHSQ
jgi:type I restriction enzyme R subunit